MPQYDLFTVWNLHRYDTTFFDAHRYLFYLRKKTDIKVQQKKQKIHAKLNNMHTLGKLTHVSDATLPQ